MTKSEPGANHVGITRRKTEKHRNGVKQENVSIEINVFKTKRAYNKPPETAVFCYTENNNKKALTSIIQDKKTIIKLSKQTLLFTFLAATSKKKKRIKSGIQKTLILVFILKHGEK